MLFEMQEEYFRSIFIVYFLTNLKDAFEIVRKKNLFVDYLMQFTHAKILFKIIYIIGK